MNNNDGNATFYDYDSQRRKEVGKSANQGKAQQHVHFSDKPVNGAGGKKGGKARKVTFKLRPVKSKGYLLDHDERSIHRMKRSNEPTKEAGKDEKLPLRGIRKR